MIVQCPDCHTRFRLAETRLVGANPMLKCSRCRHIFPAPRRQRFPAPASPAPPEPDGELNLSFDDHGWDPVQPELPWKNPDDGFSIGAAESKARSGGPAHGDEVLSAGRADESRRSGRPPERPAEVHLLGAPEQPEAPGADDADDWLDTSEGAAADSDDDEAPPDVYRVSSLFPCLVIFSVVVAGYFFFSRMLLSDQAFAEAFVSRLPMVGDSLAADRLLFRKVALSSVNGAFMRLKDGREVYVVAGNAVNTAARPLRNIQIQGALVDASGREVRRELVTCGGMISPRLLKDLSAPELDILRKVEPQRRFVLPPGESTSFAIVFLDAPAAAAEFTARVTAAQRQS